MRTPELDTLVDKLRDVIDEALGQDHITDPYDAYFAYEAISEHCLRIRNALWYDVPNFD